MNIPESVKIGGITYKIEITDRLTTGSESDGEITFNEAIIRLAPREPQYMCQVLLHEIVHAVLNFLGNSEHDETKVDLISQLAYSIITDNPALFAEEVGDEEQKKHPVGFTDKSYTEIEKEI